MLSAALDEIHREYQAAADRRDSEMRRRASIRQADAFLQRIEDLIERSRVRCPSP
jgi:hypothetical protein